MLKSVFSVAEINTTNVDFELNFSNHKMKFSPCSRSNQNENYEKQRGTKPKTIYLLRLLSCKTMNTHR